MDTMLQNKRAGAGNRGKARVSERSKEEPREKGRKHQGQGKMQPGAAATLRLETPAAGQ